MAAPSAHPSASELAGLVQARKASIEQSRHHAAMFNGAFFRQLLPYMEELKVLPKAKVDALLGQGEAVVERALSTRELLQLAIAWGLTGSAAEFWRTHKTKAQLVLQLRRKKAELEYEPPEREGGMVEVGEGLTERASAREGDASNAVKAHRRQSLQVLSNVMGGAAYSGDKFGQRGDYTGGMMYSMRRRSVEVQQITAEQWEQLRGMQAGAHEVPDSPSVAGSDSDESSAVSSARGARPGLARLASLGSFDPAEAFSAHDATGILEALPEGALSPSADRTAAFLGNRTAQRETQRPALPPGTTLPLGEWVERNVAAAEDDSMFHTPAERAFATRSLRSAMGVADVLGAPSPAPAVSVEQRVLQSKILRGASCNPPSPDPALAARVASKVALYTVPLARQAPAPVRLTPRDEPAAHYPPMMDEGPGRPGQVDDARYGFVAMDQNVRAARAERLQGGAAAPHAASPPRRSAPRATSMSGHGGGAPGPIPSPMLLPSPSGPILAAALGAGGSFVAPAISVASMPSDGSLR